MSARQSASEWRLISRNFAYDRLREALRIFVGRGRRYSVKQLSNGTGVPDRTIESALAPQDSSDWRPMPIEGVLSICMFLGADFTSEMLAIVNQGAFDLPDGDSPDPQRVACEAVEDAAGIARCAADGAFGDDDRSTLAHIGQRKITRGQQLVSLARGTGSAKVAA